MLAVLELSCSHRIIRELQSLSQIVFHESTLDEVHSFREIQLLKNKGFKTVSEGNLLAAGGKRARVVF